MRPVGKLRKNNLLRFENGDFAPTVGITEEMRAECDVELYLDSGHKISIVMLEHLTLRLFTKSMVLVKNFIMYQDQR